MQRWYYLPEDKLPVMFNMLKEKYAIVAPTKNGDKHFYTVVDDYSKVSLNYVRTVTPLKKFLYPNGEILYTYNIKAENIEIEYSAPSGKYCFFGVHPCDSNALVVLDFILSSTHPDFHYTQRRRNSFIVVLDCKTSDEYCFCESVNSRIPWPGSYNIRLYPANGGFKLQSQGAEADNLVSMLKLEETDPPALAGGINKSKFDLPSPDKILRLYESETWDEWAGKCLFCGSCIASCPTCACFDVRDEINGELTSGYRFRVYDGCVFKGFTKVAGGRVDRESENERFKNRFYHKFVEIPSALGRMGCTGCGRCIAYCPRGINPVEVLLSLKGGQ